MNDKLKRYLDSLPDYPDYSGIAAVGPKTFDLYGNIPLHYAAIQGDAEMVELLVAANPDINCQGEHGYTPLHEAVEQKKFKAVQTLLLLGADSTIKNDNDMLALDLCTTKNEDSKKIASLLLEY